jgi:hypothetical protein
MTWKQARTRSPSPVPTGTTSLDASQSVDDLSVSSWLDRHSSNIAGRHNRAEEKYDGKSPEEILRKQPPFGYLLILT